MEQLKTLWRGDAPLWQAFWLLFVALTQIALGRLLPAWAGSADSPAATFWTPGIHTPFVIASLLLVVPLYRSARAHARQRGPSALATAAAALGILNAAWIVLGPSLRALRSQPEPLVVADPVVLGLMAVLLGAVFLGEKSAHWFWQGLYKYVPTLLLCYFAPSLLNTFNVIDPEGSRLYYVSSRYLLPACLIMLTLSTDLKAIVRLGYKAVVMFLTGTAGILLGGPLAIFLVSLVSPETVGGAGPDAVWRGMTTVAGSWIGGGANQAAMKEVFEVSDQLFGQMVAMDILWGNLWMAVLLYLAARADKIDRRTGADTSAIDDLKARVAAFHAKHDRLPTFHDLMFVTAIGFGLTGLAHAMAGQIVPWIEANAPALARLSLTSSFFWVVVIATTGGLLMSFTRARNLEGAGASKVGSVLLYILIASIGMQMDVTSVFDRPGLFAVGGIWMSVHAGLLIVVAVLIRAPLFYMAVGSQANVGGAASAPVVATAFHPSLAPVGVLLAVLGYTLGTYAAWICGLLMQQIAP